MAAYAITWDDQAYGEWRIEPYEGGVIAVTDRRDMSDSVVLFCNDPGSLKLLLVTRLRFPNKTGKLASSEYLIRSEEHTSELQSLMRISYAVFCLKKTKKYTQSRNITET